MENGDKMVINHHGFHHLSRYFPHLLDRTKRRGTPRGTRMTRGIHVVFGRLSHDLEISTQPLPSGDVM
jgi:hypothetical protein